MFALALVLATGAVALRALGAARGPPSPAGSPGLVLVVVLALSVPVGEALVSAVGTNLFGGRNLVAACRRPHSASAPCWWAPARGSAS